MKRTIQGFVLAGSLVLGGTALAQGSAQGQAARDANAKGGKEMAKGGMVENRGFMVPSDEKAFLERLHYVNQMEIKLAQLAQQNASSPDVKSFADMMQKEHTTMDQRLMAHAQQGGMKLADQPKPMNELERKAMAADKALMEEMQLLKGEPFDAMYMASQVADHDKTLGKVMAGQKAFTSGPMATMLSEASQGIIRHRQHAYSVLGKLGQGMTMGVGGAGSQGATGTGTGMGTGTQPGTPGGHMGTQPGTPGGTTGSGSQKH